MRSSDLWLGLVYDATTFTMLSGFVLLELADAGLGLGTLYNVAASRHLYARDEAGARACLVDAPGFAYADFDPWEFASPEDLVSHLWRVAERAPTPHAWLREVPS
jgi:hypothetical protein